MARIKICKIDSLIIVDMQNDFMPGGALPIENALSIIPKINKYIDIFSRSGALIVATRDWHPPNHISFKTSGGPWPPHCIQNTKGAEFVSDMKLPRNTIIISKAVHPEKEAYSGFDGTELDSVLRSYNIRRVFIAGVATDYCVKATAVDAFKHGYETFVLSDGIRGVDIPKGSIEKAIRELLELGVILIDEHDIVT